MELAQFITNEQVGGSSPLALSKFLRLRSSMDSEHRSSKPEVASSSLAEANSILDFGLKNKCFLMRNLKCVIDLASIAKRSKATVCKTVNHRFKSDCSLQLYFKLAELKYLFKLSVNSATLSTFCQLFCGL